MTAPARAGTAPARTSRVGRTVSLTPRLTLVPARRSSAAKAPFVVLVVVLVVVGLLGLLLLNTTNAQASFRLHDLSKSGTALDQQEQALTDQLARQQAPAELAADAHALGMVPAGPPAFLRLPDGKVLGIASKAAPAPAPVVAATAKASPAATPSAKPAAKAAAKPSTAASTKPSTKPGKPTTKPTTARTTTGAHR